MGKTLALLLIGVIVGAAGLYAYQDAGLRTQVSEFVGGLVNSVPDAPTPTPTAPALAVIPSPTTPPVQVVPVQAVPTSTATPTPTSAPKPQPTTTATRIPTATLTPAPAKYSIEVVGMELLDSGQVDFLLEVKNEGDLERDEIAQVEMVVDNGVHELVNIIGKLSPGESRSFVFTRALTPGSHTLKFTIGDSHTTVSVNVATHDVTTASALTPASPYTPISTATPTPTMAPMPESTVTATSIPTPIVTLTPTSTNTPLPTNTPAPEPTSTSVPPPQLRHIEEKRYMLKLINAERAKVGLDPVVLGNNIAAQFHAEAALENCFASHWGIDGLKPYMRYSLAGGYQSNGENGSGSDYCIKASDGYRAIQSINTEIRQAMEGWMDSLGHRSNILDRWHKKVNIGLAWDRYNFLAYQHFEGDYVEYDELPSIENGVLRISGRTKNGARFDQDRDLGLQIYYDPPTHPLTRGQITRTYCYDNGLQIAALREPLPAGWHWDEDEFTRSYKPCPDPYHVPADASAPRSHEESHRFWKSAYDKSQERQGIPIIVPWLTASEWAVGEESFSVNADLSDLIAKHGDGVYTILVWGNIGGERAVISEYSILHGVTPPDTYSQ